MAKKKEKNPKSNHPYLFLKYGVVIVTTRSGLLHAAFFDEDNDYPSLIEALICMAKYFDCDIDDVKEDVVLLYERLYNYTKDHDCGSIVIVENEGN